MQLSQSTKHTKILYIYIYIIFLRINFLKKYFNEKIFFYKSNKLQEKTNLNIIKKKSLREIHHKAAPREVVETQDKTLK